MSEIDTPSAERSERSPASLRGDDPLTSPRDHPVDDDREPASRVTPVDAATLTRGGRIRKWDREPLPHDWRFYVGNLGKTLIAVGLLMFGFVGYQLYGTGIETAAAQSQLEDQFEEQLSLVEPVSADFAEGVETTSEAASAPNEPADSNEVADTDDAEPIGDGAASASDAEPSASLDDTVVPVEAQNIPDDLENGDALAKIEIPRIGVSDIVVAGVDTGDLKRGPGHFPDTPLPGQLGNAAIAGHRTTYGQPFRNVDQLQVGDEIRMTTLSGVFVYKVTGQVIVEPSEYQVVATTDPTVANLTLTSCHPVFTAQQRIVIFSELDRTESAPVGAPVINYGRPDVVEVPDEIPGDLDLPTGDAQVDDDGNPSAADTTTDAGVSGGNGASTGSLTDEAVDATDQLGSAAVNAGIADAFSDGWFSDPGANPQVGLWGVFLGAIAIAAYAVSRRFRSDLLGLAAGLIPFTLALYFFFQNVNRLLPPHL